MNVILINIKWVSSDEVVEKKKEKKKKKIARTIRL